MMNKLVVAGLIACATGTGLWAAFGAESQARSGAQVMSQELRGAGKALALQSWRDYMRQIGWTEDKVQVAHPSFVDVIATQERLSDGTWQLVFDGTRPGELRTVTLRMDDEGSLVGEPQVEWADMCMEAGYILPGVRVDEDTDREEACH